MSNQTNLSAGSIYIVTERNCLCFCFETIYLFFFLSFFWHWHKKWVKIYPHNDKISWTCVANWSKHACSWPGSLHHQNIIKHHTDPASDFAGPHRKCSDWILSSNTGNYQGTSVFSLPPEGFEWKYFQTNDIDWWLVYLCETAIRWMLLELADYK